MSDFITVARWDDLQEGTALKITVHGSAIALFKTGGRIFALDDLCPHRGASLSAGCVEKGHVYCSMHGWRFNLENGSCETRPDRPSRTYLTRVEDGAIQVQLRPCAIAQTTASNL